VQENINKIEDKLDFEFEGKNKLFAGRFCQYYPDIPDKNQEEEISEVSIFATKTRKKLLSELLQTVKSDLKVSDNKSKIVLDGSEGRGKTYSLLLLADLLRKSSNIFLVYVQNSKKINDKGWEEICKQFEFSSSQEEKHFYEELKSEKNSVIQNKLNNILKNNQKIGILNVFMIDQINFLNKHGESIVEKMYGMSGWDVELCSQSANNEPKKAFTKDSKPIYCPELMNEKEIQALIKDYLDKSDNDFEVEGEDFNNLIQYTGFVPREVIRLIKSEGDSMDEKLENYINTRSEELLNNHETFRNSIMGDIDKNKLNIAAFYTDTNIPVCLASAPFVDKQIQIAIKEERDKKKFYCFSSTFPLCKSILKKSIVGSQYLDLNFFEERLKELRANLKKSDIDAKVKGIIYEEFIHATIQDLQKKNQRWIFNFYSQSDVKKRFKKYLVIKKTLYLFLSNNY